MAKLYFRYGAMGSSKTANAIMVQYNYHERGQSALMLKPCLDNRDGERVVGSRSGLTAPCIYVEELDSVDLDLYNCVIVDEAQFLTKAQVQKLADIADEKNIPVICYGLRADFQGNLFEGSTWLMAWADTIEEIKTVCWCGRKATYNARVIDGKVARSGEQIVLGGNESYVALCRKHWKSGELAPSEIRKITSDHDTVLKAIMGKTCNYPDDSEMYLLSLHGQPAAEAIVSRNSNDIIVHSFHVREEQRGMGYGRELMKYLLRSFHGQARSIRINVPESAAGFFRAFGFMEAGHAEDSSITFIKDL